MGIGFIGLGGNLGNVAANVVSAREALNALPGSHVTASSMLYATKPLGPAGQPDFLNAVVALETGLSPDTLLEHMQEIEADHGRRRDRRWGPRTLDLDLLAYEQMIMDTSALTLPHPHMHERMFVLCPLCDIAPDWHHPGLKKTAGELMEALITRGEKKLAMGKPW